MAGTTLAKPAYVKQTWKHCNSGSICQVFYAPLIASRFFTVYKRLLQYELFLYMRLSVLSGYVAYTNWLYDYKQRYKALFSLFGVKH